MELAKPMNVVRMRRMKQEGARIAVVTAYDYPSARLAEQAGADVILVGDSLGNVVLGYDSTLPVTLDDMIHHTKAVTRGVTKCFVVTDLPFLTYRGTVEQTLKNAGRIMQEGLAKAVKMEGGAEIVPAVTSCVKAGIPVMGHLGFTPQSVHQFGGFFVQGKTSAQAKKMLEDAKQLEQAGVFAIVLELVPAELASFISQEISVPTIGIGAGAGCDGQVLVYHDLLQYGQPFPKKFVKTYANLDQAVLTGIAQYVQEVKDGSFPNQQQSFSLDEETLQSLYGGSRQSSNQE